MRVRKVPVAVTLGAFALLAATLGATRKPVAAACSADQPSCTRHQNWACFHEGMIEPMVDWCDPETPGCL